MLTKTRAYLFIESFLFELRSKFSRFLKCLNITIVKEPLTHEKIQESIIEEELRTIICFERLERLMKEFQE